jgi:hypothetical protein
MRLNANVEISHDKLLLSTRRREKHATIDARQLINDLYLKLQ